MTHPAPRCPEGYDQESVFSYLCDAGESEARCRFAEHLESTGCAACTEELRSLRLLQESLEGWKPATERVDHSLWAMAADEAVHPAAECPEGYDQESVFSYLCDADESETRRRFTEHVESTGCAACRQELRSLGFLQESLNNWVPSTERDGHPLWAAADTASTADSTSGFVAGEYEYAYSLAAAAPQRSFVHRHAWGLGLAAGLAIAVPSVSVLLPTRPTGTGVDLGALLTEETEAATILLAQPVPPVPEPAAEWAPGEQRRYLRRQAAAAEQGDARAQFELGRRYATGRGVPRDDAEAVSWFQQAAEQGHFSAQFELGHLYATGRGVPQDDAEAVRWFRQAAERVVAAQFELGSRYSAGRGVPQDKAEAVRWFQMAAQWGLAEAQFELGNRYATGQGVSPDDVMAARWFQRAAQRGHAEAQFELGSRYIAGRGVPQDDVEAVRWYRRAAEQGHAEAQLELVNLYAAVGRRASGRRGSGPLVPTSRRTR